MAQRLCSSVSSLAIRKIAKGRPLWVRRGAFSIKRLSKSGWTEEAYVTNVVKHFKYEQRGKRRLHKQPIAAKCDQCRWWLDRELALVQPRLVIALGATAARELMGRPVVLARERGRLVSFADGREGLVTIHPSAILRVPDEDARRQSFAAFVSDLKEAVKDREINAPGRIAKGSRDGARLPLEDLSP